MSLVRRYGSQETSGDDRFVSIVALGGLIARRPMMGRQSLERALVDMLGDRRPEMIEANVAAFSCGYQTAVETAARSAAGLGRSFGVRIGLVGR